MKDRLMERAFTEIPEDLLILEFQEHHEAPAITLPVYFPQT